jgi:protease PrsW
MLELLVLALAPTLFIFLYIYRKDCYEPEPLHLVAWVFFLGALSVIPAAAIEMLFPEGVFTTALVAPVVEESLKFLVVFLAIYRSPEFDEPMDGIVYAMAAGLGFATVENLMYVLEGGVAVGIIRAIVSVPGHVIFSCIWGFALGTAKFRPRTEQTTIILAGLFWAMLLHGIFNFSLEVFEAAGLLLILLVLIPLGWRTTCRNIQSAHASTASACFNKNPMAAPGPPGINPGTFQVSGSNSDISETPVPAQRFCTNCGFRLTAGMRFCENCGNGVGRLPDGDRR